MWRSEAVGARFAIAVAFARSGAEMHRATSSLFKSSAQSCPSTSNASMNRLLLAESGRLVCSEVKASSQYLRNRSIASIGVASFRRSLAGSVLKVASNLLCHKAKSVSGLMWACASLSCEVVAQIVEDVLVSLSELEDHQSEYACLNASSQTTVECPISSQRPGQ